MAIRLKRAYDPPAPEDGTRILVERLWPRGVSKERARIDEWVRDLAPSPALRKWYAHDVRRWDEFRARYVAELEAQPEGVAALRAMVAAGPVTFVFAARDVEHSSATVLRDYLSRRRRAKRD